MESLGVIIFWTSIYLAITAILYALFVHYSATPTQSRWFILTGLFFSLALAIIGLLNVIYSEGHSAIAVAMLPEAFVTGSSSVYASLDATRKGVTGMLSTQTILLYASFGISLLLFFRIIGSLGYLAASIRFNRRIRVNDVTVLPVTAGNTPFSFFGFIFMPEDLLRQDEVQQIILHERAHIQKFHSFDLLFIELFTVLFWFHPGVWYLRSKLRCQHEYEADRFVLDQQVDKQSYQRLLLEMSFKGQKMPITNSFNYPSLKERIMMMNQRLSRSKRKGMIGMAIAIPLFAAAFFVQACSEDDPEASLTKEAPAAYADDPVFTVVEQPPVFPGGEKARQNFLQDNLSYPEEARNEGIEGTVFVTFIVEQDGSITNVRVLRGIGGGCDEEAVRVVEMMPDWEPAYQRGEPVRIQFNMPIRFRFTEESTPAVSSVFPIGDGVDVLVLLDDLRILLKDGNPSPLNEHIRSDEIKEVSVIKGDNAREVYGYDRVLVITRK